MPYFGADYVRQTLDKDKEYCSAGGGEVFLIKALEVEEEEKRAICDIVDKGIAERGSISNGDILDGAMQKCSELFERYPFLTRRNTARAVFAAMFGSKYSFNKAMVSSLNDAVKGPALLRSGQGRTCLLHYGMHKPMQECSISQTLLWA